ncbi:aldo/keto reductase [Aquihabitans sp. G128]|nr:aldo/keto reductase [Aquihabitans sp. G128]QXC60762.1 aldo/keto reductase [Aquihabitans sp. G128]
MSEIAHRRLGTSGLVVSTVGLGANNFGMRLDRKASAEVIHAAVDAGITLIDTSDSYSDSEDFLGEALEGKRDQVVLATKFGSALRDGRNGPDWGARGSRRYIRTAVESSLRRLRTDRIDLYQLHFPDAATPMAETLAALTELVHEGKVLYVGSSNLKPWQVADAEWLARDLGLERFVSAQNEYSLLDRRVEAELVPALEHYGIGLLPYFPLASGLLTGKYKRGEVAAEGTRVAAWGMQAALTDAKFDVVEGLEAYAAERGITLLDVAFGALAAQPAVASVIAGATSPAQVQANVAAGVAAHHRGPRSPRRHRPVEAPRLSPV